MPAATGLPRGTVTLLFTDIEGSTHLLQELGGDRYVTALTDHRRIIREVFARYGGVEVDTQGDSFHYGFPNARDAVLGAAEAQRRLESQLWGHKPLRVRIGIHTGHPMIADGLYAGIDVHRAARVMTAGHGGQVLIAASTAGLVHADLPPDLSLRDLGEHRLKDLSQTQRLYQVVIEGLPSEFPPPLTLENRPTNLPTQPTPLIGREREIGEVTSLLRRGDIRLLTLTGPPGTGKTRLAVHSAAELVEEFDAGVYFVSLAPLTAASLVPSTIAQAIGVREHALGPLQALAEHLRDRAVLLVLDNFEHVVEAATDVSTLLASSTRLKVLVTSRTHVHVLAEQEYPVPPLALPDGGFSLEDLEPLKQCEAVRLFIERAEAVKPSFRVTRANAPSVAEICVRLDGLPLAIELAAACIRVLSPQAIQTRLDESLKLLTRGARDAEARQRTLRATIEWSYELLSEEEQALFVRLSVFPGGCRVDAAEAICNPEQELGAETLDLLASLTEKNLLRRQDDPDGEPRFSMLGIIREYAAERLALEGSAEEIRSRQADHFLASAETLEPLIREGGGQTAWLDLVERDHSNLRAAADTLRQAGRHDDFLRLAAALCDFFLLHSWFEEGVAWFDEALRTSEGTISLWRTKALRARFWLSYYKEDLAGARELAKELAAASEAVGDEEFRRSGLAALAIVAEQDSDLARARGLHAQLVALEREGASKGRLATALLNLGVVVQHDGDEVESVRATEEALALFREAEDSSGTAIALHNLAFSSLRLERLDEAERGLREALEVFQELADRFGSRGCLFGLAQAALKRGDAARAAALLGACEALSEELDVSRSDSFLGVVEEAKETLGPHVFEREWGKGLEMTCEAAAAFALAGPDTPGAI